MTEENNYVVIALEHYNNMLNELFTLRQNNAFLNGENATLERENGDMGRDNEAMLSEIERLSENVSHLRAQLDLELCECGEPEECIE